MKEKTMKIKIKDKVTPKMIKGLSKLSSEDQDYGVLFYFTEHEFQTFEECVEHWENQEIVEYAKSLREVMAAIKPKLDALNDLNDKLT